MCLTVQDAKVIAFTLYTMTQNLYFQPKPRSHISNPIKPNGSLNICTWTYHQLKSSSFPSRLLGPHDRLISNSIGLY